MANVTSPSGLRPVGSLGGRYAGNLMRAFVPSSDGTALYIGDPVILKGTASVDGYPHVGIATAAGGAYVSGVVCGLVPDSLYPTTLYRAASTARYLLVDFDPRTIYEIEEDGVGGALGITGVSGNADLIAGSGSTATGLSGWLLDSSTAQTTATLQLRTIGAVDRLPNDPASANAKFNVLINLHSYTNTTGI